MNETNTALSVTSNTILMNRIRRNYVEFRKSITALDAEDVFDMAAHITAANTVHALMTGRVWLSEAEAVHLLRYDNPMEILTECWRCYSLCNGPDFEAFVTDYAVEIRQYNEAKDAVMKEAIQKYGVRAFFFVGIISDVIDICHRLLPDSRCFNDFAKGGGYCPKK